MSELEDMIERSEALIVLAVVDDSLTMYFSENLDEHIVLDMLSAATSKMYHFVDTSPNQTKH